MKEKDCIHKDDAASDNTVQATGLNPAGAEIAVLLVKEIIRRQRVYDHPASAAARGLGRLWRSIASGGWE